CGVSVVVGPHMVLVAPVGGVFAVGEAAGAVAALEERGHRLGGRVPVGGPVGADADAGDAPGPFAGGHLVEPADAGHPRGPAEDVAVDVHGDADRTFALHGEVEGLGAGAVTGAGDGVDDEQHLPRLVGADGGADAGELVVPVVDGERLLLVGRGRRLVLVDGAGVGFEEFDGSPEAVAQRFCPDHRLPFACRGEVPEQFAFDV